MKTHIVPLIRRDTAIKYFAKSHFYGWCEVSKENYDKNSDILKGVEKNG